MASTLEKLGLAGLGAINMTQKRAEELFDRLVREGQARQTERQTFVKDVMSSAERARKDMEHMILKQVRSAMEAAGLPSREDLARVEAKLDELLARRDA